MLWCHDFQLISFSFNHTSIQIHNYTHAHTHTYAKTNSYLQYLIVWSIVSDKGEVRLCLSQYSQRVALSRESTLAFRPPAWSPLRYLPPRAQMAILLRSQNSSRNWTGVELLHTTAVSSPTHQYFPWESAQKTHTYATWLTHCMCSVWWCTT